MAIILGFLMLLAPAVGPGSNILGLILSRGGGLMGMFVAGGVVILLLALRSGRRNVDAVAAPLFRILGVVAMIAAPIIKGVVTNLLFDADVDTTWLGVLWLSTPRWFVYGFMVGFGMIAVLLGSKREEARN